MLGERAQRLWDEERESGGKGGKGGPSLLAARWRLSWWPLLLSALLSLPYAGFALLQPFLVRALLQFVQGEPLSVFSHSFTASGWGVALVLGFGSMLVFLIFSYTFYQTTIWGMHYRGALRSLIFGKALRLAPGAHNSFSSGQILTLMSVDIDRIFQCSWLINWTWLGVIMIVAVLALLSEVVGQVPAICAAVAMGIILFAQWRVGVQVGAARRDAVRCTEQRLKVVYFMLLLFYFCIYCFV